LRKQCARHLYRKPRPHILRLRRDRATASIVIDKLTPEGRADPTADHQQDLANLIPALLQSFRGQPGGSPQTWQLVSGQLAPPVRELSISAPDESPRQRTGAASFCGLIDLWARARHPKMPCRLL